MHLVHHRYESEREPEYWYWERWDWKVSQRFDTEEEAIFARQHGEIVFEHN
jgi:hypothetical protein